MLILFQNKEEKEKKIAVRSMGEEKKAWDSFSEAANSRENASLSYGHFG